MHEGLMKINRGSGYKNGGAELFVGQILSHSKCVEYPIISSEKLKKGVLNTLAEE